MIKKLGNYSLVIGLLCQVIFFSSSTFLVDQAWFLLGGIGFIALGLLIKRRGKLDGDGVNSYQILARKKGEETNERP
jgi:hypothetical protein